MFKPFYIKIIFQGWINWFLDAWSDLKYKKYFDDRLNICKNCEHNKSNICDICHCVLKAKTKAEQSKCPIGKWDTIENTLNKYKNDNNNKLA